MRRGFDYGGVLQYIQKTLERTEWTSLDVSVTIFFVVVLSLGVVYFILTQLTNIELRGAFTQHLFSLFFMVCMAYLFWMTDLVFGLPFGWSRFELVPAFFGIGLTWFFIAGFIAYWREISTPIAQGYRRCPGCKSIILKLSVRCPECRRKL